MARDTHDVCHFDTRSFLDMQTIANERGRAQDAEFNRLSANPKYNGSNYSYVAYTAFLYKPLVKAVIEKMAQAKAMLALLPAQEHEGRDQRRVFEKHVRKSLRENYQKSHQQALAKAEKRIAAEAAAKKQDALKQREKEEQANRAAKQLAREQREQVEQANRAAKQLRQNIEQWRLDEKTARLAITNDHTAFFAALPNSFKIIKKLTHAAHSIRANFLEWQECINKLMTALEGIVNDETNLPELKNLAGSIYVPLKILYYGCDLLSKASTPVTVVCFIQNYAAFILGEWIQEITGRASFSVLSGRIPEMSTVPDFMQSLLLESGCPSHFVPHTQKINAINRCFLYVSECLFEPRKDYFSKETGLKEQFEFMQMILQRLMLQILDSIVMGRPCDQEEKKLFERLVRPRFDAMLISLNQALGRANRVYLLVEHLLITQGGSALNELEAALAPDFARLPAASSAAAAAAAGPR